MKISIYGPGMRVEIRRGRFPLDPSLPGRTGTVMQLDDARPERYAVTLDGEREPREFAQEELRPLAGEARPTEELGATGPGIGPTPSGGSGGRT